MTPFDLAEPKTLSEAFELLRDAGPTACIGAGCTAFMLIVIASRNAGRTISLEERTSGYFETTLGRAELITTVRIPIEAARQALGYRHSGAPV